MASMHTQLPILQTNNIERPPSSGITLSVDDPNPRVGCDTRIEPVDNTICLELPNARTLKLGSDLQQEQRDILTPALNANTDLFTWSGIDLPDVDPQVAVHDE